MRAQLVVLAGPSGAGKSRLAQRLSLPVLRLDDFYRNASDPRVPRISEGHDAGQIDWDDPKSWKHDDAVAAIWALCRDGRAEVPVYDIARDGVCGSQLLDLAGARIFVAEGIFAAEIVPECRERGLLAAAYCITQAPWLTFVRRLTRDLREQRKPPLVLVRRGLQLRRRQPSIVAAAAARGCRVASAEQAAREIETMVR